MLRTQEINKIIGTNIKKAREASKMSQIGLAKKLHITQGSVSKYELGMRSIDAGAILLFAKALDCTTDKLLDIGDVVIEMKGA